MQGHIALRQKSINQALVTISSHRSVSSNVMVWSQLFCLLVVSSEEYQTQFPSERFPPRYIASACKTYEINVKSTLNVCDPYNCKF